MTQIFLSRAELVPAGETTQEHRRLQQEEAEMVEVDRTSHHATGGGLFKGRFRYFARRRAPVIRDVQDGVDRCPRCTWELEEGECGSCGYPHIADDLASMSGSLSEGHSLEDELFAQMMDDPEGHFGLEDDGSAVDWDSESDLSLANYTYRTYGVSPRDLTDRERATILNRHRGHVLTVTDEEHSSTDDEDAGSLDSFVVNDEEDELNPPVRRSFVRDRSTPPYRASPSNGSSLVGSPSTHYDTEEVAGIEGGPGTYASNDDGTLHENSHNQSDTSDAHARGTRLGRRRDGQSRARARPLPAIGRWNRIDRDRASASHESTQEVEDDSDDTPIVRTRRRAHLRRLSSSGSDSGSVMLTFPGPSLSRRSRRQHNDGTSSRSFSPRLQNPTRNERGSGSSNGTSRGVPIEIESDSDSPVPPPRRSRIKRTVSHDFSDEDQTSIASVVNGRSRGSQSSSGTATVGRQSPAQDTTMTPTLPLSRPMRSHVSPILIESSPARQEGSRYDVPASRRSEFPGSPAHNRFAAHNPSISPPASTTSPYQSDLHVAMPPRPSPRPRHRSHRIPSRSPRQPSRNSSGTTNASGSSNPTPRHIPTHDNLSSAEQRHQQAANDEAARKAARKAEKKRLKREKRQRQQNQAATAASAADTVGGDAFGRR